MDSMAFMNVSIAAGVLIGAASNADKDWDLVLAGGIIGGIHGVLIGAWPIVGIPVTILKMAMSDRPVAQYLRFTMVQTTKGDVKTTTHTWQ
jgi:hypothetical protein